jgi:hypothetical protein
MQAMQARDGEGLERIRERRQQIWGPFACTC